MLINTTKIKKNELIETIRKNLEQHKDDVKEALELRRHEMKEFYEKEIVSIADNSDYQSKESIHFPMPQDNSSDYLKAIKMLEMTQDVIIELSENQFDKLVLDNWQWKDMLRATSAIYGKSIL